MNILPLYHADVFALQNIGTIDQRQSLLNQIAQEQINDPTGQGKTNPGCWRTHKFWNDMDWLGHAVADLAEQATEHYIQLDPSFKKPTGKFNFEIWTNVNQKGARNVFHAHKKANFSAVYYLQAEDTGNLRFANPENLLGDCNGWGPFTRDFRFTAKDGDLILWPSWVPHEVEPNPIDKARINIAFDVYFTE